MVNSLVPLSAEHTAAINGVFTPVVSNQLIKSLLWVPDDSRSMGMHIMGGKGSGKSRLMGRGISWLDFARGVPLVILDPHGPTIDNFVDKLVRLPRELQEQSWKRVLYIDMSGKSGYVLPFPLYYRLGNEGPYEVSQRYLDVIRKLDPNLQTASIEGWNPLWRIGTSAGMILSALGFQITEAEDLIRNPEGWQRRFAHALSIHPEIQPAVDYFLEYCEWKEDLRSRKSDSFLNKVALFTFDPSMQAMFGASEVGVDWQQVVQERQAVLLDFRQEHDIERRRLKMFWTFDYFLSFVKHRGAGRHRPISLVVDELTSLLGSGMLAADIFASELDELINVLSRNYRIWLTLSHQELFQMSERVQKTLMGMGTQILGVTSDRDAALSLARQFFRYDPYWVKKREPVYFSGPERVPDVIDYRSIEFTMEEQSVLNSDSFTDQGRFHFLVRAAAGEGDIRGELRSMTLKHFDEGIYIDAELVARAREALMERRGKRIQDVLSEIERRRASDRTILVSPPPQVERIANPPSAGFATMKNDAHGTHDDDNPPEFGDKKAVKNADPRR